MLRRLLLLSASLLFVAGCSSGPFDIAPVSGKITLDGKPLAKAAITFTPVAAAGKMDAGPSSYGVTDAEGRYTLVQIGKESKGATVGKHKVRVMDHDEVKQNPADDSPVKRKRSDIKVPPKYNAGEAILEFEVTSQGTTSADFDLNSK